VPSPAEFKALGSSARSWTSFRPQEDGGVGDLACSAVLTGLLAIVKFASGQDSCEQENPDRVVRRTEGKWKRIAAVPSGTRRYTLSLPPALLRQIESGKGLSDEFDEFIQATLTGVHPGASDVESLGALASADPARAVIAATLLARQRPLAAKTVAALGDAAWSGVGEVNSPRSEALIWRERGPASWTA